MADHDIPKEMKFLENEKLLRKLVELGLILVKGLDVQPNIVDKEERDKIIRAWFQKPKVESKEVAENE